MNERMVQTILINDLMHEWHMKMVVPNSTSIYSWEADVLSVAMSGLSHEFEIKTSRADFRADAKKVEKHGSLYNQYLRNVKQTFDNRLGTARAEELRGYTRSYGIVPSYFWYVIYGFDVSVDEVPPYAGLVRIVDREKFGDVSQFTHRYGVEKVRSAPRLNRDKFDDKTMSRIARLLSFRLNDSYGLVQDLHLRYDKKKGAS